MNEPKTWGDVIRQEANGDYCAISPVDRNPVNPAIASVTVLITQGGQRRTDEIFSLAPGTSAIVCRWLLADCPPLTDPIPQEAPEPAKVVRWEPTEDQESKLWDAIHGALDSTDAKWDTVLRWLRDCQRDLPAVEPPTPEDAKSRRIDELERLLVQIGDYAHDKSTGPTVEDGYWEIRSMAYDGIPSDLPPTPPTDRFAALESRLAALENRAILKPDYDPRDVALVSVPRIGKATYNTPTTLEQALTVETQVAPEPEIPLPDGCSQDEIKQAARYAINQIARDAGLNVVVK